MASLGKMPPKAVEIFGTHIQFGGANCLPTSVPWVAEWVSPSPHPAQFLSERTLEEVCGLGLDPQMNAPDPENVPLTCRTGWAVTKGTGRVVSSLFEAEGREEPPLAGP